MRFEQFRKDESYQANLSHAVNDLGLLTSARVCYRALLKAPFAALLFFGSIVGSINAASAVPACRIAEIGPQSAFVTVPPPSVSESVSTGEATPLAWDYSNLPQEFDGYLVVGTPDDIRFEGEGFVAVPPNARAPRSLRSLSNRTRLIVPLSGGLSNRKGSAKLILFESGTKIVSWELVQLTKTTKTLCKEQSVASGSLRIEVRFGAPQLLAQDRFSIGAPKRISTSNSGRYRLLSFSDRYQVLDGKTDELLVDRTGTQSTLSPSGRYVTSFDGAGRLEITDIVAKRVIFKMDSIERMMYGGPELIGWLNFDSLLLISYNRQGGTNVILPLINGRKLAPGSISCNGNCTGLHMSSLALDFDQLTYSVADDSSLAGGPNLHSLVETAGSREAIEEWDRAAPDNRFGPRPIEPRFRPEFVVPSFKPSALIVTKRELGGATFWWFSDRIEFTYWSNAESHNDQIRSRTYVAPPAEQIPALGRLRRGKIARRSITDGGTLMTPKSLKEKLDDGLKDFGVKLFRSDPGKVELVANGTDPEQGNGASALLNEIVSESSRNTHPASFRKNALPNRKSQSYLLDAHTSLGECSRGSSEIPEAEQTWERNKISEPPFVSVNRLAGFVRFRLGEGTLYITQQYETCGTGPLMYGDVVGIFVPKDRSADITFKRLGSISAEAGLVSQTATPSLEQQVGWALQLSDAPALLVKVIAEKFVVIASKNSGSAALFRITDLSSVQLFRDFPSSLDLADITMTEDGLNLVQINNNGLLSFYDLNSASRILNGKFVDDELALFDEHLNFESTPEGASYVYVSVPGSSEVYSLDQFADHFFKRGLARDILSGKTFPLQDRSDLRPPTISVEQTNDTYKAEAKSERGLKNLIVSTDGLRRSEIEASGQLDMQASFAASNIFSSRWVTFWATDKSGLFSNYRSFFRGAITYPGKLRLVRLGISKFNGAVFLGEPVHDLSYATNDASRFEKAISSFVAPSYASYEILRPSPSDLLNTISFTASETTAADTLILFLSSHGLKEQGEFSLVLPADQAGAGPNLISFDLISKALASAKGRVFVFLDACHSADAEGAQDSASDRLTSARPSVVVISASKGKQTSLEGAQWGGGVFTTAIIDFLSARSNLPARDPRHYPTVEEMYAEVRKDVSARTRGLQTPWLRRASWQGPQSIN